MSGDWVVAVEGLTQEQKDELLPELATLCSSLGIGGKNALIAVYPPHDEPPPGLRIAA
jgi:hypothetical protein